MCSDSRDIQYLVGSDLDQLRRSSALFLLKLKEKRYISQAAIDDIVEGSRNLVSQTIQYIRAGVEDKLAQAGLDPTSISGLDGVFSNDADPFEHLATCFLQEKYYHEELGLVVSFCCSNSHISVHPWSLLSTPSFLLPFLTPSPLPFSLPFSQNRTQQKSK